MDLAAQTVDFSDTAPSSWINQTVAYARGLGNGSFGAATSIPLGDGTPGRMTAADLAGDGRQTLLVATPTSIGQMVVADGGSSFSPLVSGTLLLFPTIGDFNGDHAQDVAALVVADGWESALGIAVYLNGCP